MQIRDYSLPAGWYPREAGEVSRFLSDFMRKGPFSKAVIAPHAGWYYSGRLAARAAACLQPDTETVIVIGGHLSDSPPLFAMEDAIKTPFGPMPIDAQLRGALLKSLNGREDSYRDNTVEVHLPIVRFFFPQALLIWLRLSAQSVSFEAGKIISREAAKLNRKVNVLASTDLTHYGVNYGFSPRGMGKEALRWMREENDAAFIKAVEAGDSAEVLRCAQRDFSACSAGAVLGAMGFSEAENLGGARLLEYATSADVRGEEEIPDSFVGYAAMAFATER